MKLWETKAKQLSKDIRKKIVDLHKCSLSLDQISRSLGCHVHLLTQLHVRLNTMGMLSHRSVHQIDWFLRPTDEFILV